MTILIDRDKLREAMRDCESITHSIGYSDMIAIIDEANAVNRWIPCSERLPEIDNDVIVYYPYWRDKPIQVAHLNYDKFTYELSDGEFNLPVSAVTHWMPLPEPPGGGDDNV